MTCSLCGFEAADRFEMGHHLATEHPDEWEMAVQVVAMQMLGPAIMKEFHGTGQCGGVCKNCEFHPEAICGEDCEGCCNDAEEAS